MKVYFTASTTARSEYKKQYQEIISLIKAANHNLLSGEQAVNEGLFFQDQRLSFKQIFSREKKLIDKADCLIAEVTSPSTGVGGEITYALTVKKPVLALFYKKAEDKLSPMIAGNPSDYLYLEHYDDDNLKIVLQNFLRQVKRQKEKKGKLIVIDGGDGSGKQTQADLLVSFLKKKGVSVKYYDFPRYYTSFHGKIVGRFLAGEFGNLKEVNPYLASLTYALDRASVKEEMDEWLSNGGIIIANRYATSNMGHQAAKLPIPEREQFIAWLDELEYRVHKIPREDLVIYLYVPWETGFELSKKRGRLDIHEQDIKYRQEVEKMYLWLSKNRENWVKIDCMKNGQLRSREEIHREILKVLKDKKII